MKYKFEDIIYNITTKKKPEPSDKDHYIGLEHLDSGNLYVSRWGADRAPDGEKIVMKKGDVLFGKRRAYQKKVAIAPFDGIFSAHGMVLRPKEDVILKEFLPFFISSDVFLNEAIRISVGGLSPSINWKDIKELTFNLPSLDEQKHLADKLWSAYEVKQSYIKMIDATNEMVKAKFVEMFGGITTKVSLSSLCKVFCDGDWIESKDQSENGIRLIQTGNVGNGEYLDKGDKSRYISDETFKKLKCTEIFPGDILISRLPDPIGRACILPTGLGKTITSVDCTIIRFIKGILPLYFISYTKTNLYQEQIIKFISGSTRARISRGNLSNINVPLPPMELQKEFVSIAEQADASIVSLKKSIESIDKVIKSLINENL